MQEESPIPLQLLLVEERLPGRIAVDLEPFFDFDTWMNSRLDELVAEWEFYTPPDFAVLAKRRRPLAK